MSQPDVHPFHLTKLVTPALDGIIRALSDRGGQTEAQRLAVGDQYLTLVLSFLPRDAIDIMLAGQAVMFNELLADGTRDVLRGMMDTMKQRSQSTLVAMGRLTQGHIDRLEKRGTQPWRTEVATPQAKPRETQATEAPAPAPPAEPPLQAAAEPPAAESSWLDEPFVQWLVETPADLAEQPAMPPMEETPMAPTPMAPTPMTPTPMAPTPIAPTWVARRSDAAFPRQPAGYPPALTLPALTLPALTLPALTLVDAAAAD